MSIPNAIGARVNLASDRLFGEFILFGEDASRILVACGPAHVSRIKEVAEKCGVVADTIGETTCHGLEISLDGKTVVSAMVSDLSTAYESALEKALRTDPQLVAAE